VDDSNFKLIMHFIKKCRIEKRPVNFIGLAGSLLSPDCGPQLCDLLVTLHGIGTDEVVPLIIELSQVPSCLPCFV
jgi:hypothetical protein